MLHGVIEPSSSVREVVAERERWWSRWGLPAGHDVGDVVRDRVRDGGLVGAERGVGGGRARHGREQGGGEEEQGGEGAEHRRSRQVAVDEPDHAADRHARM